MAGALNHRLPKPTRESASHEITVWVMIGALLDGVIDANGVDARCSALHLNLRIVNAWLVINKCSREIVRGCSPINPEVIGSKRNKHGAHTKIDPPGFVQRSHAGVNHRVTSAARCPSFESFCSQFAGAGVEPYSIKCGDVTPQLQVRLILKFLNEMRTPMQPL